MITEIEKAELVNAVSPVPEMQRLLRQLCKEHGALKDVLAEAKAHNASWRTCGCGLCKTINAAEAVGR